MKLFLHRVYFAAGTNGTLTVNDEEALICHTIELPWRDNHQKVSCIPAGTYTLVQRFSFRFGWHLQVQHVPGRSMILIHPANNAMRELQGCIAPVMELTGPGTGNYSRRACNRLMQSVSIALLANEPIFLIIHPALGGMVLKDR